MKERLRLSGAARTAVITVITMNRVAKAKAAAADPTDDRKMQMMLMAAERMCAGEEAGRMEITEMPAAAQTARALTDAAAVSWALI